MGNNLRPQLPVENPVRKYFRAGPKWLPATAPGCRGTNHEPQLPIFNGFYNIARLEASLFDLPRDRKR
jgi:hypothetical protein